MKSTATAHNQPAGRERAGDDASLIRELGHGGVLAAVADGVGSARAGGEAARRALEMLGDYFAARPEAWTLRRALSEFVSRINLHLHNEAQARFDAPELATTLSAIVLAGNRLYGVNVGDSPVFFWHAGQLQRLSHAHVSETPGQEHVLTQAIGLSEHLDAHFFEITLHAGDRFVLCTDGVSGPLEEAGIARACANGWPARSLVIEARQSVRNESDVDDATAVVVDVIEIGDPKAESQRLEVVSNLRAGEVFPDGRLVRPLDENRRVWLAESVDPPAAGGSHVVLKFPPLDAAQDESRAEGFLREAWQAARLDAPEFVRARVPTSAVLRYYVQEYIEAPTLRRRLRDGLLPVEGAIALGRFLTRAAQTLVRHDLAHGDLKPDNILVLREGNEWEFRLIDLGTAAPMFSVVSRAGTSSYLAPERFHHAPLCERSEVFTIGAILYEALTGRLPYGEIERFQTPRFSAPPKAPSRFNPAVPHWLDSLVQRAIAANPPERYQHYSEVAHDLAHPEAVAPFHPASAPLIERNPVRFYKLLCLGLFALNLVLFLLLFGRTAK